MTTLVFEDSGWTITSSSWSAGSKEPGKTILYYHWGPQVLNMTGSAQVALAIDIEAFNKIIARGGNIIDLRTEIAASG